MLTLDYRLYRAEKLSCKDCKENPRECDVDLNSLMDITPEGKCIRFIHKEDHTSFWGIPNA